MRAQPSTKPAASGGRTLSRESFFSTDPHEGEALLLPYGGGLVPVVVMDAIGGYYKPGFSAYDALCRSEDGRYFLVREVSQDLVAWRRAGERPAFRLPRGRHWLRIKRVSLRAAMLHVTRNCSYPLRQDLWDATGSLLNPEAKRWSDRYTAETGAAPAAVISAAVTWVLSTAYDPVNGGGPHDDHRRGEFWCYIADQVKEAAR